MVRNGYFQHTGSSLEKAELGCQVHVLVVRQYTCCVMLGKLFTLSGPVSESAERDTVSVYLIGCVKIE